MELVEKRILSKEETDQLLKKCKQGDSLAREKLVKHNLKLVLYTNLPLTSALWMNIFLTEFWDL